MSRWTPWAALIVVGGLYTPARAAGPAAQPPPGGGLREGSLTYQDPRLTETPPPRAWRIFLLRITEKPHSEVFGPLRAPKYNVDYPFRLQVLCLPGVKDAPRENAEPARDTGRRFVIHYMKEEDELL